MSTRTSIAWTDHSWNPVRGCSLVSKGCESCYAMKQAHRFSGPGQPYDGLTEIGPNGPRWNGSVRLIPEALEQPLHWRKPRRVFVNSMSDLFHEDVPDDFIDRVLGVVMLSPWHTYQVLTKRPERMASYFSGKVQDRLRSMNLDAGAMPGHIEHMNRFSNWQEKNDPETYGFISHWPLKNLWLGVSVENQATADERIPLLLQTPAAVRFVSAEPLLGPITLKPWISLCRADLVTDELGRYSEIRHNAANEMRVFSRREAWAMHWVIVGGESGPCARPCDVAWIRSIMDDCQEAGVPVFVKQLGARPFVVEGSPAAQEWSALGASAVMDDCGGIHTIDKKGGGDMAEWPEDLRVREFPGVPA